jgi:catechol 2,3-dioxygenase-like lactoylglutathione lyase family enzyme
MLLYTTLGTGNLQKARTFYNAALAPLGYVLRKWDEDEIGYGPDDGSRIRFWVVSPYNKQPATFGNGTTVALDAPDRASVNAFYHAALAHGGTDEGAPGLRPFHAHFYAAFVRDPDGNKISAVCEKPE